MESKKKKSFSKCFDCCSFGEADSDNNKQFPQANWIRLYFSTLISCFPSQYWFVYDSLTEKNGGIWGQRAKKAARWHCTSNVKAQPPPTPPVSRLPVIPSMRVIWADWLGSVWVESQSQKGPNEIRALCMSVPLLSVLTVKGLIEVGAAVVRKEAIGTPQSHRALL